MLNDSAAVVDGERPRIFRNKGGEARLEHLALTGPPIERACEGSGAPPRCTTTNPDNARHQKQPVAAAAAGVFRRVDIDTIETWGKLAKRTILRSMHRQSHDIAAFQLPSPLATKVVANLVFISDAATAVRDDVTAEKRLK